MTPTELKAEIITRLTASPALAPYLPVLVSDGAVDLMTDIQTALDERGFCIAVSLLTDAKPVGKAAGMVTGYTEYAVYCCDNGHTVPLTREAAMEAVIKAVSAPSARGEFVLSWEDMGDVSDVFGFPTTAHLIRGNFVL